MIKTTNLLIVFTIALLMLSCGKTDKKPEVIEEKKEELAIEVDTATSYETEAIKLSEPRNPQTKPNQTKQIAELQAMRLRQIIGGPFFRVEELIFL